MGFVAKQNSDFWVFWDTLLDTYRNKVSRWGASDLDPVDREGRKGLAWDGWSGVGPCPPRNRGLEVPKIFYRSRKSSHQRKSIYPQPSDIFFFFQIPFSGSLSVRILFNRHCKYHHLLRRQKIQSLQETQKQS